MAKPHPDSINFHLKYAELNKDDVIFIGDSVYDLACARAASVKSVAVLWGWGKLMNYCYNHQII